MRADELEEILPRPPSYIVRGDELGGHVSTLMRFLLFLLFFVTLLSCACSCECACAQPLVGTKKSTKKTKNFSQISPLREPKKSVKISLKSRTYVH